MIPLLFYINCVVLMKEESGNLQIPYFIENNKISLPL